MIPWSSDMNVFSIVELLTNSLHDRKWRKVARDCGARIYRYVDFLSNWILQRAFSIEFRSARLRSKFSFLVPSTPKLENILDVTKIIRWWKLWRFFQSRSFLKTWYNDVRHVIISWNIHWWRLFTSSHRCSLLIWKHHFFIEWSIKVNNIVTCFIVMKVRKISRKKISKCEISSIRSWMRWATSSEKINSAKMN